MDFLTDDDILAKLRTDRVNQITDNEPSILTSAEAKAIAMVVDATNQWFDIAYELARTGTDRHVTLIRWVADLTVYFVYDRIPDRMVPERVIKNYNDVVAELKRVEDQKRKVTFKRKEVDGVKVTKFRFGGEAKRGQNPFGGATGFNPTTYQ